MTIEPTDALIVFAHGSRVPEANQAVVAVAESAAAQAGFERKRAAFLELAEPDLKTAVTELAAEGARRIVVAPYFLVMGVHLRDDLPRLLDEAAAQVPGVQVFAGEQLGGHPLLAGVLAERAVEAIKQVTDA